MNHQFTNLYELPIGRAPVLWALESNRAARNLAGVIRHRRCPPNAIAMRLPTSMDGRPPRVYRKTIRPKDSETSRRLPEDRQTRRKPLEYQQKTGAKLSEVLVSRPHWKLPVQATRSFRRSIREVHFLKTGSKKEHF